MEVQTQSATEFRADQFPPYFHNLKASSNSPLQVTSEWGEVSDEKKTSPTPSKHLHPEETPSKKLTLTLLARRDSLLHSPSPERMNLHKTPLKMYELPSASPVPEPKREVTNSDVLWAMLNDLTGKDKLAKLSQYTLRLLLYHLRKTQDYLSDDMINIKAISLRYNQAGHIMDLAMNFLNSPRGFARVVIILVCSLFTLRFTAFVPALGTYRQLLRFGKSPFRVRNLFRILKDHLLQDPRLSTWKFSPKLFSKLTLSELVSLYYSVNDESMLLYKLGFLKNKTWKSVVVRHESYAWYCDSWLAMYTAYTSLQSLRQQEMDLKIQIQVKKRAKAISKQLLASHNANLLSGISTFDDDSKDALELREIQYKIANVHIDIYKTLSDIIFNSYTVFKVPLHFDTAQIWMGISAAFWSSFKLYRDKKRELLK